MRRWTVQKEFGPRVRAILRANGMTAKTLADKAKVSRGYLYRVLRGEQIPGWSIVVAVIKVLGMKIDDFRDCMERPTISCPWCGKKF